MIAQERYHASNSHKRGAIAERLHVLASCLFVAGIVVCLAEMFIEFGAEELQPRACIAPNHMRDAVIFFAALFPIVSAAIHGILATTEYTKVADNSGETAEAIHGLVERLKKIPAGMEPANPTSLEPMRDTVLEFATLAINEATGWRAMLRDKNVPLA